MTAHGALARAALMPSEPPRIGAPGEFPSVASSGAMGDIGGYDSNLKQDACGGAVNIASLRARSRDPNRHIPVKGAIPSLELSRLHLGKFDPDVYTTRGSIEKSWVRPPFQGESTSHRDFSAPPVDSLRAALRHADPQSSSYSWHQSRKFEGASLSHTDFAPPPLHALLAAYRAPSHDAAGAEPRSRSFDPFRSRRMDLESEGSRRHGSVPPPIEALPRGADSDRLKASSLSGDAKAKFTYDPLIHSGVEPPKLDQLDAGDALANRAREKFTQEGRRDPHLPVWPQDIHARQYSQVESTTHHDFRPPPLDVLRAALHSPQAEENSAWKQKLQQYRCPFQGKSSMHQDFPPPPAEALRAINKQPDGCPHDDVFSAARAVFTGESTTHTDFPALPLDALRAALRHSERGAESKEFKAAFAGESSTHRDFTPPPLDAIRSARSRGESTTRRDFLSPPVDALRFSGDSSMHHDYRLPHEQRMKLEHVPRLKFEGESSTHRDFPPHPAAALDVGVTESNRYNWFSERAKFEGQSTLHRDFPPPPLDALRNAMPAHQLDRDDHSLRNDVKFEGESLTHRDFKAPPPSALRADFLADLQKPSNSEWKARCIFTGESSTHRDYQPPSLEALRETFCLPDAQARSKEETFAKFRFEGKSTTHTDFTSHVHAASQERPYLEVSHEVHQDKPRFEGESSTHRDFLPPPMEALRNAFAVHQSDDMAPSLKSDMKFQGESSMRRDFQPPPPMPFSADVISDQQRPSNHAWQERTVFTGESSTHRDFVPPPLDALRSVFSVHQSDYPNQLMGQNVKFEGESSTHRDFKAPPSSALRADFMADLRKPSNIEWKEQGPFMGESSTHRDYQPHSLKALRETFCLPGAQARSKEEICDNQFRFEGKSTTHTDFTPHVHAVSQERPYVEVSHEVHQDKPRFLGESSTHRDFLPPPMEALRDAFAVLQSDDMAPSLKSDMKFQGESSMRRDFQPPPPMPFSADVISDQQRPSNHAWQERTFFTGESSTHRDFVPPPLDALRSVFSVHQSDYPNQLMEQNVKFEGESSMHRDFKAPPSSALRADFMADLRKPSNIEWKEQGPFTGESSAHRDYQPPSLEALRETFCLPGAQARSKEETYDKQFRFEGKSTTHTDFTPRAIERLRSTPRRIAEQIGAFCGESTTHRDFQAPLNAASREDSPYIVRRTPPAKEPAAFAGESSTHRDFQPPPLDALRATFDACQSQSKPLTPKDAKKFEGESSTHLAFQAPPREALLESAMVSPGRRDCKSVRGSVPFCGESSCHRDYRAPSLEALRSAFQLPQPQVSARGSQRHSSSERIAFSGQSATHCDFTPPPRESILAAFQRDRTPRRREDEGRKLFCVEDLVKSRASEAQSTSHRDFAPPLRESSIAAGRRTPNPKRESSVDLKFIAPAHESLQGVAKRRASSEDPNFRRMSSTHRDFTPPPRESLLLAFQNERQVDCRRQAVSEKLRFQGESSMRQHFVAPPQEALRAAFQTPGAKAMPSDSLKFESQSSTHRDFTPPPPDPRQTAAGRPTRTNKENADPAKPASSRPVEILYKQPVAKFGEQHAMHRNKLLETNQGAVATTSLQKQDRVVHFASSLTHNDSRAETCSSLSKTLPAGYPTRPNENRSKSAPRERSQHSSRAAGMLLGGSTRNSTPETTSRHDFRPVLSLTAAAAGKSTGKGQRSHSTPADSRPVMASGGNISQSLAKVPPSSVQSSAHRDFTPPPREAYEEPLKRLGAKRAQQPLQESRDFATTSRAAFTSHPSKPSAMSSTGSCPAHHVWSSLPPPKPPSGRE